MPAKPHITIADDNQTPTTAEQQTDTNWAQPVSVRDGHNATLGAKADTKVVDPNAPATEIGLLKGQLQVLNDTLAKLNATLTVSGTVGVNNFPATQQVDPIDRAARLAGHVTVDSSAVTTNTLQSGAVAIGNGTPMPAAGLATVALYVSGTFVATVVFEGTTVATNPQPADWFSINAHQSGTTTVGTTATAPGIYRASVAGLVSVRARVSTWTSGAVTVTGTAVAVEDTSKVTAATLSDSTLTSAQRLPMYLTTSAGAEPQIDFTGNGPGPTDKGILVRNVNFAFNNTGYDHWRNNTEGALLTSLARTATTPSPMQTNQNGNGVMVEVNVTAIGTGSLTPQIIGVINGQNHILMGATVTITVVGKYLYELYPGIGAASNEVTQRQNGRLPRTWFTQCAHSDVSAWTYSIGHSGLL